MSWGEVAHILPASPNGPPGGCEHSAVEAEALTNDTENLILACHSCHEKIDRDAGGYPRKTCEHSTRRFSSASNWLQKAAELRQGVGLIFLNQHFAAHSDIQTCGLLVAMFSEGLFAICYSCKQKRLTEGVWLNSSQSIRAH